MAIDEQGCSGRFSKLESRNSNLNNRCMASPRDQLLHLLATKSFKLGQFKLSSGGTSDYYIDCRTTTLDAQGSRLTGEAFLHEIRQQGWHPQAVGGLTLGADPIAVAVAVVSSDVNAFLVRKAEKQHGTGQRIEGFREKGAKVVIVDDVCTTGASTIQAIEVAREFGFEVIGVVCLVERTEAGGRASVEKAAAPARFVAIFTDQEVRREHLLVREKQAAPPMFAVSAKCDFCDRPAVTNVLGPRCDVHKP
jgi:orotate phosphoribosyltransferase